MDSNDIWKAVRQLEKEKREKQRELMEEYDRTYYYPKLKELRDQCEHKFKFSHVGPVGGVWFYCSICGKSKYESDA